VNNGTTYSNKYFAMTANINLGNNKFTPIGKSSSYAFKGIFDGKGYTISNIKITESSNPAGIFGYVKNATISNLTISNGTITQTGASQCAGGIVGWVNGSSKIEKCTNDGVKVITESDSGNTEAGGIVGYINGSSGQTTTITWCTNYADVNNDSYSAGVTSAGGIVGRHNDLNHTNISLCKNFGSVYCGTYVYNPNDRTKNLKSASKPRAGGIIGSHYKGTIAKSFNYGDVTSGIAYNIVNRYGYYSTDTGGSDIYKVYGADSSYAGGIAGFSNDSITYCFNKGVITAKAKAKKDYYEFGLEGSYKYNGNYYDRNGSLLKDWSDSEIDMEDIVYGKNSFFHVRILESNDDFQTKTQYNINAYAFGITPYGTVTNCYNTGSYSGGTSEYSLYRFSLSLYNGAFSTSKNHVFLFSFINYNLQGPLTKGTATSSYYTGSINSIYINYSDKNTPSKTLYKSNSYNFEYNVSFEKTQHFIIQKAENSSKVYFYIDDEGYKGRKNIISYSKSEAVFNNQDYMYYVDDEYYKGTSVSKSDLYSNLGDSAVWAQSSIINGGTPYIKEMYWEGCASK
ncbi:MAG: hypothetical protein SOV27_05405, partial [Eubacteriales bacterium]|nr:hypothetical protein [Eubacteriales bacterium]